MDAVIKNIWPFVAGIGLILTSLYFLWKGEISVGFEGHQPLFYIKGTFVKIISILIAIIGILILFIPDIIFKLNFAFY
jgi:hypothetical protein